MNFDELHKELKRLREIMECEEYVNDDKIFNDYVNIYVDLKLLKCSFMTNPGMDFGY